MNLLYVLQPTPPEIWKQISGVKVPVEKSRKRPANGHTYVKGHYTNIDDLILKMESGKPINPKTSQHYGDMIQSQSTKPGLGYWLSIQVKLRLFMDTMIEATRLLC